MFWRKCPTPEAVAAGNALGAPPKLSVAPSCPGGAQRGAGLGVQGGVGGGDGSKCWSQGKASSPSQIPSPRLSWALHWPQNEQSWTSGEGGATALVVVVL